MKVLPIAPSPCLRVSPSPPMHHWLKFNLVGVLGFALQTGVLFVLTHCGQYQLAMVRGVLFVFTRATLQVSYLAATATAVELAVLNNFVWHQRWTWRDRPSSTTKESLRRLVKFNFTSGLFSIIGNLVFMSIFIGRLGLPVSLANLASVAACSIVSFFLADRIAFESP